MSQQHEDPAAGGVPPAASVATTDSAASADADAATTDATAATTNAATADAAPGSQDAATAYAPPPLAPTPPARVRDALRVEPSRASRLHALVLFGLGVAVLAAGLLKVLPGAAAAGGTLAFFGLVLLGLSFVPVRAPAADTEPPLPAPERLLGTFYQPTRVFRNLRAHPRWLLALVLLVVFNFGYSFAFTRRITPERIADFTTEKVVESGFVTPEIAERMKADQIEAAKSPAGIATQAVSSLVWTFVIMAAVAALYMLGVMFFGGRLGYWQAVSVALHAALPAAIVEKGLSLVILYLKSPDDLHPILGQNSLITDNLGALVTPGENPVLFALLAPIGVISFYRLWLAATGLRHGSERLSAGGAWTIALIFWFIFVLLGVGMSVLFGNFMS
jgi:Yip1 domain